MATRIILSKIVSRANQLTGRLLTPHGRLRCVAMCVAAASLAGTAFGQERLSDIGKRVSRAVVKLESFDGNGQPAELGSGFIVNSKGLIVTNYHVIRGAYQVNATSASGEVYSVTGVVDFDPEKDFAILKVSGFDLPVAELGNSNQVEILEEVIAIGHPLGLDYTSSTGVISQRRQMNGFTMLQTTAATSPGNSGGPLLNLKGQVIAIVTAQMREGQNLNFALPINYVRASLESDSQVIKYTLPQIAEAQAKIDQENMVATLKSLFTVYEDKYETYDAVVPRSWRFDQSEGWSEDKQTYRIIAMTAPESAARAEVNGYLSEGIRITISVPPKGQVWTAASPGEYATFFSKEMLQANPGFVQTSTSSTRVGQEPVKILEFVGQNPNVEEPERDRFYVLAKPECNITIEVVAPASKFKEEDPIFRLFIESFEFKTCPKW